LLQLFDVELDAGELGLEIDQCPLDVGAEARVRGSRLNLNFYEVGKLGLSLVVSVKHATTLSQRAEETD